MCFVTNSSPRTAPLSAIIEPTERSAPRATTTTVCPSATISGIAANVSTFRTFAEVWNCG